MDIGETYLTDNSMKVRYAHLYRPIIIKSDNLLRSHIRSLGGQSEKYTYLIILFDVNEFRSKSIQ